LEHIAEFGKNFPTREEFEFRFALFEKTEKVIRDSNADSRNTFILTHNMFSTLTEEERKQFMGLK
jgi:hypothetical protein